MFIVLSPLVGTHVRIGHVASSFCIHPKVLPRSCSKRVALQLDYRLQQLHSPGGARTSLLRRNEKEQRIHWSRLVLACSHAVPPSTQSEDASRWCLGESALSSRSRPRAPRGSFIWLRLGLAANLELFRLRIWSMTLPSTTVGSSS